MASARLLSCMVTALVASDSNEAFECSGNQCEVVSDSSAFIQRHVQVSEFELPNSAQQSRRGGIESPEVKPSLVLQEEVEEMVRSGQTPSASKIKDIEELVTGQILPELMATHRAGLEDMKILSKAVSACNKDTHKQLKTTASTIEVQVTGAGANHSECRTGEAPLNASKVSHCADLEKFLKAITLPAVLPSENTPALMGPYLEAMGTYFCPKHGQFTKLDYACTNATNVYDAHRLVCNQLQAQYELDFCTWRAKSTDTCMAASMCYASAVAAYKSKEASTKVLEHRWKTEYTALKKIICYVNVWLSDSNTGTADEAVLKACNTTSVDTTPMSISYPGVPCAITCDTTPTAAHPGTAGFAAAYSSHSQAAAPVTPCMVEQNPTGELLGLVSEAKSEAAKQDSQKDWDLSGRQNFILSARFKTTAAAGTIVGKPFADGLWKNGGSAGQGKMVFLRGGRVGMDIGWVGYFGCGQLVNDGQWHKTALKYVAGESNQYQLFVDDMMTPCGKGLAANPDNPGTTIVIGTSIGHRVANGKANGDMAPDFTGELGDVSYVVLGTDGSPIATTPAPTPAPTAAPSFGSDAPIQGACFTESYTL